MVLCELPTDNFLITWATLTALGIVSLFAFSGSLFYHSYVKITYEKWVRLSLSTIFFSNNVKQHHQIGMEEQSKVSHT